MGDSLFQHLPYKDSTFDMDLLRRMGRGCRRLGGGEFSPPFKYIGWKDVTIPFVHTKSMKQKVGLCGRL